MGFLVAVTSPVQAAVLFEQGMEVLPEQRAELSPGEQLDEHVDA